MIYYFSPYSTEKNLGKAYNQHMDLIGDDDTAVLTDGDTCWLTPDYGMHIAEYVRLNPGSALTCWTNRINERAEQQSKQQGMRDEANFKEQLLMANHYLQHLYKTTSLHGFVSGFCLVVPKKVWNKHKFAEKQVYEDRGPHNLLGVDNDWTNRIRAAGIPVLRMDGIYLWHTYRLLTGSADKSHLL
jgi:GT2 family glycosyltransferase